MLFHGLHAAGRRGADQRHAGGEGGCRGFIAHGVLVGSGRSCLLVLGVPTRPGGASAGVHHGGGVADGRSRQARLRLMRWGVGDREPGLFLCWRAGDCAYSAQGVIRWPASRPGGKMPHWSWGVKSILLPVCNFFSLRKCLSHVARRVYCRPGFSRRRRIAPSPGY